MRSLNAIMREVKQDWKKPYFGAVPYINALLYMETINDKYGFDDARSLVSYFLGNAGTWRGDTAKRVKLELKGMLK